MRRSALFSVGLCVVLVAVPRSAYAYLDPGTGSMILQGALAAVFAAGFTLKLYWRRVKAFFRPAPQVEEAPPADPGGVA